MVQKKGLGKGLDALFHSDLQPSKVLEVRSQGVREIDLNRIRPKSDQPRKRFDEEKIEQLSYSIKEHGVLQPIVLVEDPSKENDYLIVAGERRYRAAAKAGLKNIPAIVRSSNDLQQLEIALVENIQREDLDPIEQATSIHKLHHEFSQDYKQIAKRLGKAETTVVNLVRLLGLSAPFQKALQDGVISEGHARAILALGNNSASQLELFEKIIKEQWSVRKAELFVQAHKNSGGSKSARAKTLQEETAHTKKLAKILNTAVKLKRTAKGGEILIKFKSEKELLRLLDRLIS